MFRQVARSLSNSSKSLGGRSWKDMQTTNTPQFWKKVINANEVNARFVGDDMIEEPALKESGKVDFTMPLLGKEKTYTSPRKTYTEITGNSRFSRPYSTFSRHRGRIRADPKDPSLPKANSQGSRRYARRLHLPNNRHRNDQRTSRARRPTVRRS